MLKAATSRTPKLRYPAGPLARQLSVLKKFAPAALLDKGIRKANKLTADAEAESGAAERALMPDEKAMAANQFHFSLPYRRTRSFSPNTFA